MEAVIWKRLVLTGSFWPGLAFGLSSNGYCQETVTHEKESSSSLKCPCTSKNASDSDLRTDVKKVDEQSGAFAPVSKLSCCSEGQCNCHDGNETADVPNSVPAACVNEPKEGSPAYWGVLSDWIFNKPKLSAEFRIEIKADQDPSKKLGNGVPVVKATYQKSTGSEAEDGQSHSSESYSKLVPSVIRPMKFTNQLPLGFGRIVDGVIECGHRICTGDRCYDVSDDKVPADDCGRAQDAIQEEEIQVAPVAPPAPPPVFVAQSNYDADPDAIASVLEEVGLERELSLSAKTVVKLIVEKTELATRLEMTQQLMEANQVAVEQMFAMAERNAKLSTQLALAEARQQHAETLSAYFMEKAESAIKLSARDGSSVKSEHDSVRAMQAIQEDLSNLRKQMALLRKSSPVPFAQSMVGRTSVRPYVPTANLWQSPSVVQPPVSIGSEPPVHDESSSSVDR